MHHCPRGFHWAAGLRVAWQVHADSIAARTAYAITPGVRCTLSENLHDYGLGQLVPERRQELQRRRLDHWQLGHRLRQLGQHCGRRPQLIDHLGLASVARTVGTLRRLRAAWAAGSAAAINRAFFCVPTARAPSRRPYIRGWRRSDLPCVEKKSAMLTNSFTCARPPCTARHRDRGAAAQPALGRAGVCRQRSDRSHPARSYPIVSRPIRSGLILSDLIRSNRTRNRIGSDTTADRLGSAAWY